MPEPNELKIIKSIIKKNRISDSSIIKKYHGGQINFTYAVGNDFVIKIQKELDVLHHQPEIISLIMAKGAKVPRVIDCGVEGGKEYLVMSKIPGRKLSQDWHKFDLKQRESFISQIVEQLRIFHSLHFSKYSLIRPKEFDNFKEAMRSFANFDVLKGRAFDEMTQTNLQLIRNFYEKNESLVDEINTAVLVHNDLHFENMLYDGDTLTGIIDFDFARQAPKDYELWHLIDFFHTPYHYVEKELEQIWMKYEIGNDLQLFKKHYPELFASEHLLERLKLFFIDDILGHAENGHADRVNNQIEAYFKSDWLERNMYL